MLVLRYVLYLPPTSHKAHNNVGGRVLKGAALGYPAMPLHQVTVTFPRRTGTASASGVGELGLTGVRLGYATLKDLSFNPSRGPSGLPRGSHKSQSEAVTKRLATSGTTYGTP